MYDWCAAALRGKTNAMFNPVFLNKNFDNHQLPKRETSYCCGDLKLVFPVSWGRGGVHLEL